MRAVRLARAPDRAALVALLAVYAGLVALYLWQAARRETPTIFTDELELTQISRAIAETGSPARRGEGYGFSTLAPYLTAPAWRLDSVAAAYEAAKAVQVLVMTAAVFPAYALARTVVSRPWALFAATATVAAPALSYAPILVEEPLAYPASTLAILLVVRAVARPSGATVTLAAAACVLAAAVRSQLVALLAVLALSLLVLAWLSPAARRWRATWTRGDWVGAVTLGVGAVLAFSAAMGHLSQEWYVTTSFWKARILEYGVWAGGALAIGVGLLPAVAALAVLPRPRRELRDPAVRAFVIVTASALVAFGWYAAVKGAYLSTVFSSLVVERNLIYLAPLLFVGTALLLERRDTRPWAALAAGAGVLYLVASTPTKIDLYPYYEAHGLSILALANRELVWTNERIERALLVAIALSLVVVLGLRLLRGRRAVARGLALTAALAVLGWNLTNEIYAASGEHDFSARVAGNLTRPFDWVDEATGGGSVVAIGQQIADPTGVWLTEFWNRSVKKVWSVDGTGPGPGPTLTPDLAAADGSLSPSPETDYALAFNGVTLQAPVVRRIGTTYLYRLDGKPLRLATSQAGVYSDGWMSAEASYDRFTAVADGLGFARVALSRTAFCTDQPLPSGAVVRIGPVEVGPDREAQLGAVTEERRVRVEPCEIVPVLLRPPEGPWRVEVEMETFVPAEVDPSLSERRRLGAQVEFGFVPLG